MDNKGLTLIEVIISVAILGILALAFLNIFSNNATNIFSAGDKTENIYEAQKKIDNTIRDIYYGIDDENINVVPIGLSIEFTLADGKKSTIDVVGKKVTVEILGRTSSTLTTFIPE